MSSPSAAGAPHAGASRRLRTQSRRSRPRDAMLEGVLDVWRTRCCGRWRRISVPCRHGAGMRPLVPRSCGVRRTGPNRSRRGSRRWPRPTASGRPATPVQAMAGKAQVSGTLRPARPSEGCPASPALRRHPSLPSGSEKPDGRLMSGMHRTVADSVERSLLERRRGGRRRNPVSTGGTARPGDGRDRPRRADAAADLWIAAPRRASGAVSETRALRVRRRAVAWAAHRVRGGAGADRRRGTRTTAATGPPASPRAARPRGGDERREVTPAGPPGAVPRRSGGGPSTRRRSGSRGPQTVKRRSARNPCAAPDRRRDYAAGPPRGDTGQPDTRSACREGGPSTKPAPGFSCSPPAACRRASGSGPQEAGRAPRGGDGTPDRRLGRATPSRSAPLEPRRHRRPEPSDPASGDPRGHRSGRAHRGRDRREAGRAGAMVLRFDLGPHVPPPTIRAEAGPILGLGARQTLVAGGRPGGRPRWPRDGADLRGHHPLPQVTSRRPVRAAWRRHPRRARWAGRRRGWAVGYEPGANPGAARDTARDTADGEADGLLANRAEHWR